MAHSVAFILPIFGWSCFFVRKKDQVSWAFSIGVLEYNVRSLDYLKTKTQIWTGQLAKEVRTVDVH